MMEREFVVLIRKIEKSMQEVKRKELEVRGITGLSASHGEILIQLFRNGDQSMNSLAKSINKDKSTITALVNKLIKVGYLEKYKDDKDSRVNRVKLTPKAIEDRYHFVETADVLIDRISRFISKEELADTIKVLSKINDGL